MAVRLRLVVQGRVQGVFFRDSVRAEANANRVRGWVRNRGDGSVEVVLEGERDAVERVSAFCRVGPPRARVDGVAERNEEPEGLVGFRVR